MKKNIIYYLVTLTIISLPLSAIAQDIVTDNKSNTIFNVPSSLVSPNIAANSVGLTYPFAIFKNTQYYLHKGNDPTMDTIHTLVRSSSFYAKVTISNSTGTSFDFSKYFTVNPHVEIGFSRSIDWFNNVSTLKLPYATYSLAAFVDYQHFDTYDTVTQTLPYPRFARLSPGVKGVLDIFSKDNFAIALSGSYQRGVNTLALTGFQTKTGIVYTDVNVAQTGPVDGYFDPIPVQNIVRLSIAIPFFEIPAIDLGKPFAQKFGGSIFQIVPAPYYYATITNGVEHTAGFTLNILPYKVHRGKNFNFSSALNLGYNVIDSTNRTDQRYVFFAGTFSFGSPKPITADKSNKTSLL